jgi:hypothetical protein
MLHFTTITTGRTRMKLLRLALLSLIVVAPSYAADAKDADGFVPMFNGKNLSGWINVNCNPKTFFVKDDMIITTGKPTGYLRTEKQYENFVAEFDWMHVPPKLDAVGNSGFFVWADPIPAVGTGYTRGIEVQVLVNLEKQDAYTSHGDLFSIHGAHCKPDRPHPMGWERCLPSERRAKGANEWNHYKVTANDGSIKLEVNGKEVSGVSKCTPRKGYLALESEGSECRFKNLKIRELPSTNPKPEEIANEDQGFRTIYFGDLSGWKTDDNTAAAWKPNDWKLINTGKGDKSQPLLSDKQYLNYEMVVDWSIPAKNNVPMGTKAGIIIQQTKDTSTVFRAGSNQSFELEHREPNAGQGMGSNSDAIKAGGWNRTMVTCSDGKVTIAINGKKVVDGQSLGQNRAKASVGLIDSGGPVEYANIFIRELK